MRKVRSVISADIDLICQHRHEMFMDSNRSERTLELMQEMTTHFRSWLEPKLRDNTYFGYVVEQEQVPVASVGMMIIDWPPHPFHPDQGKRGYVLNVFVEPSHRNQGIGRELMNLADCEFKRLGVSFVVLHPTQKGREMYERLGWQPTGELSKSLA